MHRTGHWLGLDVHDAGDYMQKGKWRKLKPGMVLTVEPGCYIRPAKNVPKAFWNIGVRIEDDVLVTARGREVLTAACPKTVKEVEETVLGRGFPDPGVRRGSEAASVIRRSHRRLRPGRCDRRDTFG